MALLPTRIARINCRLIFVWKLPVAILGNLDSLDTRADGTVEFNEEH